MSKFYEFATYIERKIVIRKIKKLIKNDDSFLYVRKSILAKVDQQKHNLNNLKTIFYFWGGNNE